MPGLKNIFYCLIFDKYHDIILGYVSGPLDKAILEFNTCQERLNRGGYTMNIIQELEKEQLRNDIPQFQQGDTVRCHVKVVEGSRERIQVFEGVVIARSGSGVRETFTVRRIASGVGVERTFPVHSPRLDKIEVKRRGIVRRAKLYYLRNLTGKAARIREKR